MGIVYILYDGEYHKVGMVYSGLNNRIKQIKSCNPRDIKIIYAKRTKYPLDYEAFVHVMFEKKRVHGEWFKFEKGDIQAIKDILEEKSHKLVGRRAFIKRKEEPSGKVYVLRGRDKKHTKIVIEGENLISRSKQ